jgi:hypothetical protein
MATPRLANEGTIDPIAPAGAAPPGPSSLDHGSEQSASTRFQSILFDRPVSDAEIASWTEPAFFSDLHLDQVVESLTRGRDEYDLKPFFYAPLRDVDAVCYRHEVLRDLEQAPVGDAVRAFAQ